MPRNIENEPRTAAVSELLAKTAAKHGTLTAADQNAIIGMRPRVKMLAPGEDIVRQGDHPDVSVFILAGMLARYHTLPSGDRQYLSLHIAGDLPDLQALFLAVMDHSLCALDKAEIALFPHKQLGELVLKRPGVGFAFWRLSLVDAAIFRQTITNIGARNHMSRLAHLFCEQFFRAREAGLARGHRCSLPLSQNQLGQALGMSHISANRAIQKLRDEQLALLRSGTLEILDWRRLASVAEFDPAYLHVDKLSAIAQARFKMRTD